MKCSPSPQLWFQLPYLEMRCIIFQIKPVSIPWDQTSLYNHHLNLGVAMWDWVLPVLISLYSVASAPHLSWCLPAPVIGEVLIMLTASQWSALAHDAMQMACHLPPSTTKAPIFAPRPAELYVSTTVRIRGWTCTGSVVEDTPTDNLVRKRR